ncbi:MAG: hypothetical protein ACTHMC_26065 [Pseudobacter sp.]|uniref:hypothetical protein n=1 Tax=Pseudobacter sp. TaxID=2045420 RepID=UPI003F80A441
MRVLYEGHTYRVSISGEDCERLHKGDELGMIKYPGIGLVRRNRDVSVLSALIIIAGTGWFVYMAWTGLRSGLRKDPEGAAAD